MSVVFLLYGAVNIVFDNHNQEYDRDAETNKTKQQQIKQMKRIEGESRRGKKKVISNRCAHYSEIGNRRTQEPQEQQHI